MNRHVPSLLFPVLLLLNLEGASAQVKKKPPTVGILEPGPAPSQSNSPSVCSIGFKEGMRDLGYTEGQNILFENHYADFKLERLRDLASQLVRSKVDVLWTHSPDTAQATKQATTSIPIVLGVGVDLVEEGLVASLARPGGNITGMELRDLDLTGKRLELFKETVPTISKVAVLANPIVSSHARVPKHFEAEARALRVQLQRVEASGPETFEKAFAAMAQGRADSLMVMEGTMFARNRHLLMQLAASKRLPTASGGQHFADAGSLISYGANVGTICRRSAIFIDKILKGSKPADLPVERPTKFDLVINLKTAKQIGVTIPPNVLARADRVIR